MDHIDAFTAEKRAAEILAGLQFTKQMQDTKTKHFSGGWRMRVSIACALFVRPDLCILDEPTNFLDLYGVLWLEDYLRRWPTSLVVVSHDIDFLNGVCTDIVHFHSQQLTTYKGNYDAFVSARADAVSEQNRTASAVSARRDHIQSFIDRFRANAKRAAMVQSRIKALERMQVVESVIEDRSFAFTFPKPDPIDGALVSLTNGQFSYSSRSGAFRLHDIDLTIPAGARMALVGRNGEGKTTLLRILAGQLKISGGERNQNQRVRIAVYRQHHTDSLDLDSTPTGLLSYRFPGSEDTAYRAHLGNFGITGPMAMRPIRTLSGGQRARVALALLTFDNFPHLLLLDEISCHLDVDTRQAVINALNDFEGAVVLVSHDSHLVQATMDTIVEVEDGKAVVYPGDWQEYRRKCLKIIRSLTTY
eukprot:gnl/Ergobibamus_cyprinoides/1015.p1 GENE.gnl/Ergobibamus_cyprinoides/1015~~gnl/Ergobibamus_cyprinoides/1015.p1  ORF type:complete len:475 (+),score=171.09 gnl/Ergobibamus_cyprinoides/1015:174-1427(+)